MKHIVEEKDQEGLLAFLGKKIEVWCLNYIYAGTLIGVNDTCIKLDAKDAVIVYETGEFSAKEYKDAQKYGRDLYIQTGHIEHFGAAK